MKRIVILSDLQVPYHDKQAVKAVTSFVKDYQPDELLCVGDEADSPEVSRWNKSTAGEYAGTLQRGLDATRNVLRGFREAVGDGVPFTIHRSNHTDRIKTYVERYAPGLSGLRALDYPTLVGYDELDINFNPRPKEIAPGWVMVHGDEAGMNRTSGGTALGIARKIGKSVISGHTHKLGLQHEHTYLNGSSTGRLFGLEVGHLMDLREASKMYLKLGTANWQQGFGILYVDKDKVYPSVIPLMGKSFVVEGKKYKW